MSTITVYAYALYPLSADELRHDRRIATARRLGTLQAIRGVGGTPIAGSGVAIDRRHLSSDRPGFTTPDFRPPETEPSGAVRPPLSSAL